ncbi:MAG: hypothetical protein HKN00_00670 [Flavobacteriaceae bacterium]|nr:hypothetical protein [Bacteroidia bacterium]NNF73669.1 hypothetical protein [Flavobacteriaceae bacterium]NNK69126.1 hypothetical protein [Flavobacteriaceae bacterium]
MTVKKHNQGKSYVILLFAMILFVFSNGRWVVPLAAWIAPIFLLTYLSRTNAYKGLIILFVLFTLFTYLMLYGIIPSHLGVLTYLLVVYYALLWLFPFIIYRIFANKISGFWSTLFFPVAAVSVEYLNTIFFGSWASVSYTQFNNLALIQISSVFGIWGVTFLVMWFASSVHWIISQKYCWVKIKKGILIYSIVLLSVLIFGEVRLKINSPQSKTATITSFTATREIKNYFNELKLHGYTSRIKMAKEDRPQLALILDKIHDDIFQRSDELLQLETELIFWPEGMIDVLEEQEPDFINKAIDMARDNKVYLLISYLVIPENNPSDSKENKSVLVNPIGSVEWEYHKSFRVPGSTNKKGDRVLPISNTPFGLLSTSICYDMDFTHLINQAGNANIDIMLVPAWDWSAINPLHARMAVYRAIENGFSMVRQTGEGLSIAVDYCGRILNSMDYFTTDNQVMISHIPTRGRATIYATIGDLFAQFSLALLIFGMIRVKIKRLN